MEFLQPSNKHLEDISGILLTMKDTFLMTLNTRLECLLNGLRLKRARDMFLKFKLLL